MACTFDEYKKLVEDLFAEKVMTDSQLNYATEEIRRYLVDGGSGSVLTELGIGIKVVTKEAMLLPAEMVSKRFVWLYGERKGEELERCEIESIGLFLKDGALYKANVTKSESKELERLRELVAKCVEHIVAFEEDAAEEVLTSLGFKKGEEV